VIGRLKQLAIAVTVAFALALGTAEPLADLGEAGALQAQLHYALGALGAGDLPGSLALATLARRGRITRLAARLGSRRRSGIFSAISVAPIVRAKLRQFRPSQTWGSAGSSQT
jgi:hypothetical protein